jgi:putative addiction module component (TIGR02574 family)
MRDHAELFSLPIEERLKLIDDLWDSINADGHLPPISDEVRALLDKCIEESDSGKGDPVPMEDFLATLKHRP